MNSPVRLGVSPTAASTPKGFSNSGLRLYFPELELWVAWSVLLPLCSSWFICARMWDRQVHQLLLAGQLQPCLPWSSRHRLSMNPSAPLLISTPPTGMDECFFFNSLVLDFHMVRFSFSSGCFLFLNCCYPAFGCVRRHNVSTYASILSGSLFLTFFLNAATRKLRM